MLFIYLKGSHNEPGICRTVYGILNLIILFLIILIQKQQKVALLNSIQWYYKKLMKKIKETF